MALTQKRNIENLGSFELGLYSGYTSATEMYKTR
jgi:hypothetical protein